MDALHAGTILLLVLWTGWLLVALGLLDRGKGLLAVFIPLAIVLAIKTDVTWRGYLMAWLPVHALVAPLLAKEEHRAKQVVLAVVSLGGLTWLWADGGWRDARPIVTGLVIAASVATLGGLCYGAWWLRNERHPRQPQPEPASVANSVPWREYSAHIRPVSARPAPTGLAPAISPKPIRAFDPAEAEATAEYTVFANLSADTNGETASIWMRRVYLVQENAGGWHLMVEHDCFPLLSVHDVRDRVESARDAGEALGNAFVDASIGFFSAKITGVFSEAFDDRGNEPERWFTQDPIGLGTLAGGISAADHDLHRAVGMPPEHVAGAFGMNGATQGMAAGIAGNMLLAPVDRQLAGMVRKVEIVGIAVGVAFGMHPLALACTKLFLRAQLNREIGNAMKGALFGRDVVQGQKVVTEPTRPVDRSRAVEPMGPGVDRVQPGRDIGTGWPIGSEVDAADDHRHRRLVERLGIGRTFVPPRSRAAEETLEPGKRDRAVSEPYVISEPGINRGIGIGPPC
jgi:hypothetical protein